MEIKNMKQVLETKLSTDYLENIKILLAHCSHKQQVEFALHCAQDCQQTYDKDEFPEIYKVISNCLELLTNWILDSKSVTEEQLETAAKAACTVADDVTKDLVAVYAVYAAYTAAKAPIYAAYTAYAAAKAPIYAANAAAKAAVYAATAYAAAKAPVYAAPVYAANAAAYAATANLESAKLKQFYDKLFTKLTENMNKSVLEVLYD